MAYTKKIARHDKILIDDVDVSNSFRTFGFTGENARESVGGFSATGNDEFLAGLTTTGFTGEAYYTEELALIVYPLFQNKTTATISWQPDGLSDATREIYSGECQITTFGPANTFGSVSVMPFEAVAADANGITVGNWT